MYKYSDIPILYEKPLKIVCVAYQEYELSNGTTRIFGELSENKQKFINLAKTMNIEYVKFSDLVKDIDIDSSNCKQSPP
jgi:ribosomal protein L7Ae-like RNA K-turn-binding protein